MKLLMTSLNGNGVWARKIESNYFLYNLQIFVYQGVAGLCANFIKCSNVHDKIKNRIKHLKSQN